jgi:hypothetical protein
MIVKGYRPHKTQLVLHNQMIKGSEFYYTFNIGRQWGKTMMIINQMLYFGFNHKGVDIGFISPTLKQSRRVLTEIIKYTSSSGLITYNKSDLTATFVNGSKVQFLSSEQGDSIRGFHFHIMFRDESAYMPNGYYHEIIAPMLLVKGFKDISISTPRGRNSDHFKRYIEANSNDLYFSFSAPSSSNPFMNNDVLADIQRQTPNHIWRQEYLAEFLDGGTLFQNIDKCVKDDARRTYSHYGGLDIGRADDYTVLSILNDMGEMVYCERWRHDEWKTIIGKVARVIDDYEALTFVEVNNQGDVFFDNLKDMVDDKNLIKPFTTSSTTKPRIIESLILAFQEMSITIMNKEWLKMELESYTFVYNKISRTLRYSAPTGLHDDGVMSLAIANYCLDKGKGKGEYFI